VKLLHIQTEMAENGTLELYLYEVQKMTSVEPYNEKKKLFEAQHQDVNRLCFTLS